MKINIFFVFSFLATGLANQSIPNEEAAIEAREYKQNRQHMEIVDSIQSSKSQLDSDATELNNTNTTNTTSTTNTTIPVYKPTILEIVKNIDTNPNFTMALDSLTKIHQSTSKPKAVQLNPILEKLNYVIDDASDQLGRFDYKNTTEVNVSELNKQIKYTDQKVQKLLRPAVSLADKQQSTDSEKSQLHTLNATAAELSEELQTSLPSIVYQQIVKLN
ncbi:hypothetical protein E3Q22_00475 [Wallemia mellicola]|uniref:Uncharacterized protein n=2 Tax=Wallemia mellicola TaxID=1708541 RepID=A0A4T0Q317_9BASI|nr:hypothetical protein E3Q24_01279 [Wallemia mellicola]TIB82050.1 hypothetical protein E3Q22_00475 [Wallemia mellicola]TIB87646.1 hypothetical protein E3Q21_01239 [Wallemia mellicola]TIB90664.1 hypothetical protein E3Q20_01226 [Wallemia mellicola]TIB93698.1 hypothetical protein E3Q19_00866 [Wallemia mellicola]